MRSPWWGETAMCIAFFGRLVDATHAASQQQRPECHRAGNSEQPKSPRAVGGPRVNPLHNNQSERDGEYQPAGQVCSHQNQKRCRDHGEDKVGSARGNQQVARPYTPIL